MKSLLFPYVPVRPHFFSRWPAAILGGCFLASLCALSGCLSRPSLNKQTFTFSAPPISATNVSTSGRVLGIRRLAIASPFDGRSFVCRTGESAYVRNPYAEFLDLPAEELMAPMRAWFRIDRDFGAVLEAGSALKPNTLVEVSVSQMFGDFRRPESPSALLTVRFLFFDATNGTPGKVILQREYSRSIPLISATAPALIEGWNKALAEILAEVASDLPKPIAEQDIPQNDRLNDLSENSNHQTK